MRLAELEQHLASMHELARIVGAMRSIASMRVQEAMRMLESVRQYSALAAAGVRQALRLGGEPGRAAAHRARTALVLCTSEAGFVGGFNERLLEAVQADRSSRDVLLLGSRGLSLARERGIEVGWARPMVTRLASVTGMVEELLTELDRLIGTARVMRVEVIFARHRRSGSPEVVREVLFPLEPERGTPSGGAAPLTQLPAAVLLERLTALYIFARLTEAAIESLAAENQARFLAMESARDNVARKLDQLKQEASRARQEEVTTELLDLVTGGQAINTL